MDLVCHYIQGFLGFAKRWLPCVQIPAAMAVLEHFMGHLMAARTNRSASTHCRVSLLHDV